MKSTDISLEKLVEPSAQAVEEFDGYEPQLPMEKLNPRLQRFVHLYLAGGYTHQQIADLLGVALITVRKWLAREDVRQAINRFQDEEHEIVTQGLKALRMKALFRMGELIDSKVPGIAYQAARDVLDRTGNKAVDKKEVDVNVFNFENKVRDVMQNLIVDVDFEEVGEK